MAGPARLTEVQLLCGSAVHDSGWFYNARILACHTSLAELTNTYAANYDGNLPDTVMAVDTLDLAWTIGQWGSLVFDQPFDYNGTENLVLEFRYNGDDHRAVYARGFYPPGGNRVLDGYSLTNPQGALRSYCNRLRIYYDPVGIEETPPVRAAEFRCSPNPFRGSTVISLPGPVRVYGADGRLVRTLLPRAGVCTWDGRDARGRDVGPGVFHVAGRSGTTSVLRLK